MTRAEENRWRLDRQLLDLRVLLRNPRLTDERRRSVEVELEALRLARIGVRVKDQVAYLRRAGVVPANRAWRPLRRGPEVWPDRTRVRIV